MGKARIWHYRDHDHGGLFDGHCYVDTGAVFAGTTYLEIPVKCRLRISEFPDGTTRQAIWGSGCDSEEYSLNAMKTGSAHYHLQVRYLSTVYDFDTYRIYPGVIYTIAVRRSAEPAIHLDIRDQWGTLLYRSSQPDNSAAGTLTPARLLVGAVSDADNSPCHSFTGTVFDFMYNNGTNYRNLSFMKNLGGVGDSVVKDWFDHQNGSLSGTVPSFFWPSRTDVSAQVVSAQEIRCETDRFRIPEYATCTLDLVEADNIMPGDVFAVEDISDGITGYYQIDRIEEQGYGVRRAVCYDVLKGLESVLVENFVPLNCSSTYDRTDWWTHLAPQRYTGQNGGQYIDTEAYYDASNGHDCWYGVLYLLRLGVYSLQLERLLIPDTSPLMDIDSGYEHLGNGMTYRWLAVNTYCLLFAGKGNRSDPCTTYVGTLFRELLTVLRVTYRVLDHTLAFIPVDFSAVVFEDHLIFELRQSIDSQRELHQICQTRLTSANCWDDTWTEDNGVESVYNNLDTDFKLTDNVVELALTAHFLIGRHSNVNNKWIVIDPPLNGQLVDRLDADFVGDFPRRTIETRLTLRQDPRYLKKIDNLSRGTSEIKHAL